LWRDHLDEIETENLLSEFYGLSLLLGLDLDRRTLQVHDTIRQFLRAQTGTEGLIRQQKRLLQALDEIRAPDQDASTRRYYYLYLPYHLDEANERDRLDSLLLDPSWLTAKLAAVWFGFLKERRKFPREPFAARRVVIWNPMQGSKE
jgi:hypothetical protein